MYYIIRYILYRLTLYVGESTKGKASNCRKVGISSKNFFIKKYIPGVPIKAVSSSAIMALVPA